MNRDIRLELTSLLQSAEQPLTLGELSQRLREPFPTVFGALVAARKAGVVDRLEGGLYELRRAPALLELFAVVHACEAEWRLDDRIGLFGHGLRSRS